ncbi:MAG: hypothetical protein ACREQV_11355, partial [Candidatus Binatia bacterium]
IVTRLAIIEILQANRPAAMLCGVVFHKLALKQNARPATAPSLAGLKPVPTSAEIHLTDGTHPR